MILVRILIKNKLGAQFPNFETLEACSPKFQEKEKQTKRNQQFTNENKLNILI